MFESQNDWKGFEKWLLKDRDPHYVVSIVSYEKQYGHCLLKRDFSEVSALRESLRPNVVKYARNSEERERTPMTPIIPITKLIAKV